MGARAAGVDAVRRTPFDDRTVPDLAKALAASAYLPAEASLTPSLAKLKYDNYRDIRFDPQHSLWRKDKAALRGAVLPPRFPVP